jgi:hypothetical protein
MYVLPSVELMRLDGRSSMTAKLARDGARHRALRKASDFGITDIDIDGTV